MKNTVKNIFCALSLLVLAACQDAPPSTDVPKLTLGSVREVGLDVARIEIVEKYASAMQDPNVEHLFEQPPVVVAKRMLNEKLRAQGSLHTLRVTIEDASVVRKSLPVKEGIGGLFYDEPSEAYRMNVSLRFELLEEGNPQNVIGNALVVSGREKTLMESASPADRDMAFFNMTENLVADLDAGFHGAVQRTFGWR